MYGAGSSAEGADKGDTTGTPESAVLMAEGPLQKGPKRDGLETD